MAITACSYSYWYQVPSARYLTRDESHSETTLLNCVMPSHFSTHLNGLQNLQQMFGYKRSEMEGKNVSMLMPNPFSARHNGYLRNYQVTGVIATCAPFVPASTKTCNPGQDIPQSCQLPGKAQILDSVRGVVGIHKERYCFPLSIMVTKISGSGTGVVK